MSVRVVRQRTWKTVCLLKPCNVQICNIHIVSCYGRDPNHLSTLLGAAGIVVAAGRVRVLAGRARHAAIALQHTPNASR